MVCKGSAWFAHRDRWFPSTPSCAPPTTPRSGGRSRELTITADCGGSNGARVCGCGKSSCRTSPTRPGSSSMSTIILGTSKWNKIEHRLFCHITQNWRGRPLTDRLAVVELIGATKTKAGLRVESALDTRTGEQGEMLQWLRRRREAKTACAGRRLGPDPRPW